MKKLIPLLTAIVLSSLQTFSQNLPQLRDGMFFTENGTPFTGQAKVWVNTPEGNQLQEINAEAGVLNGAIRYFSAAGELSEIGHYVKGKKDGQWIQYGSTGNKLGEAYYKDGKKDGIWTVWDEQGIMRYHMVYSMGKKVDTWKMWDENAQLVSERLYAE